MTGPARAGNGEVRSYGPLAEAYDIVHARKPYGREARIIRALARQETDRPGRTLLDVACGSGRHLEHLVRWFDCTGLDASPAMLGLARRRVPGATFHRGRMESFDLGREFDVVTCLFSAIGYVRSPRDLVRAVRNLARHAAPGGVVIVEPWLTPTAFRAGRVDYLVARSGETTVVRMNGTERRRGRSRFDFHYLVGRNGSVDHFVETHDLGLFDRRQMTAAFRRAGLKVRYVPGGFPDGRGLYVGRRPDPVPGREAILSRGRRSRRPAVP